ncbi:MAG: transglycosylase SLT domain-containing protein [Gammaproteobacteria bacterium]|nr:transglycosylase SLT domain-containing protein [Gammaproteobacteria bacterium]
MTLRLNFTSNFALLPLLLILPTVILATPDKVAEDRWQTERALFIVAEKAVRSGDDATSSALLPQLKGYPLYPYLPYYKMRSYPQRTSLSEVRAFIDRYGDTPLAERLRSFWLDRLAEAHHWEDYLLLYTPQSAVSRQCHALTAMIETGRAPEALTQVAEIWLHGSSRPDACDPAFNLWIKQGGVTSDLAWQRIGLAMAKGDRKLARYLGKNHLRTDGQQWLEGWIAVQQQPSRVVSRKFSPHSQRQKLLMDGVVRLIRQDIDQGRQGWRELQQKYPFSAEEVTEIEQLLGMRMAWQDHPDSLQQLATLQPTAEDTSLHETRLRQALELQRWDLVLAWIDALPQALKQEESWRYWYAVALEKLGSDKIAATLYQDLAAERSYYGFLAAEKSDLPYNLAHLPLEVDGAALTEMAARPALMRARELYLLGKGIQARREWYFETEGYQDDELKAASKLAQIWRWHDRSIFTLAKTEYWDDLELRFPIEHRPLVMTAAEENRLQLTWVYAVIRQESVFMADVVSSAGAVGLMQLMPQTAKEVAKKLGMGYRRSALTQPKTNITYGSRYLRMMLDRFDNNMVLATAAYNAGPHRVKRWLPEKGRIEAELWVETIPFRETRGYVKRVLSYAVIYAKRLGVEPVKLQRLMLAIGDEERKVVALGREKEGAGRGG